MCVWQGNGNRRAETIQEDWLLPLLMLQQTVSQAWWSLENALSQSALVRTLKLRVTTKAILGNFLGSWCPILWKLTWEWPCYYCICILPFLHGASEQFTWYLHLSILSHNTTSLWSRLGLRENDWPKSSNKHQGWVAIEIWVSPFLV